MGGAEKRCDVFLCYASVDRERVRTLYERLSSLGLRVWFDVEALLPGQAWQNEITRAITECEFFIACLSHASVGSRGYYHKEIKLALDVLDTLPEDNSFLIPVRLEECRVPARLSHRQWVDMFHSADDGFERIAKSIAAFTSQGNDSTDRIVNNSAALTLAAQELSNFSTKSDLTYLQASTELGAANEIITLLEAELGCPAVRNVRLRLASEEIQPLSVPDERVEVHAVYRLSAALVALDIRFLHREYSSDSSLAVKLIRLRSLARAGFTHKVHLITAIVGMSGDFDPEWTRNHTATFTGLPPYHIRYYQMRGDINTTALF
jgi:TIR domain